MTVHAHPWDFSYARNENYGLDMLKNMTTIKECIPTVIFFWGGVLMHEFVILAHILRSRRQNAQLNLFCLKNIVDSHANNFQAGA